MKKDSIGKKIVNVIVSILFIAVLGAFWGIMSYEIVKTIPQITGQWIVLKWLAVLLELVAIASLPAPMCWGCVSALIDYLKRNK